MSPNLIDEKFMSIALDLARSGLGRTSPNPMVGAVIVKNGKVIGKGFHQKAGLPHAEVEALKNGKGSFKAATLYVTLEPCAHQGRTPPCIESILKEGFSRVVIAMKDPDEKVSGRGIQALKKNKIKVDVGVLENAARKLNAPYIKHRTKKIPYVTLKMASTLDGKVALPSGKREWVTGERAREQGHVLRDQHDAILVGLGTIQKDDPQLTTRLKASEHETKDPIRVILDSRLRISPKAKVLRQISKSPTWIVTTLSPQDRRVRDFQKRFSRVSYEVICVRSDPHGRVDLKDLLKRLGERSILSLLVEGGPTIATSFLSQGHVDRVVHFLSTSYLGSESLSCLQALKIHKMSQRMSLRNVSVQVLGEDVMIEGFPHL